MKMDPYTIIRRPIITEKSMGLQEHNKVVFEVDKRANKHQIKKAIEELFKVKVVKVNTMRVRGKPVRRGWTFTRKPNWKKVVVTLRPGDSIDFFEGM